MTDNTALIEALERAEGPLRELDAWIARDAHAYTAAGEIPAFTASIDAALTLVAPEALDKLMFQAFGGPGPMWLVPPNERFVSGPTPAIALCIAALRAKGAQS